MEDDEEEDDTERELPPMTFGALLRRLVRLLAPYRGQLAALALCLLVEMAYTAAIPFSFALLVDVAIGQHRKDVLIAILWALGVGGVIAAVAGVTRDELDAAIGAAALTDLRRRMAAHIQQLSIGFHSRAQVGDLLARFSTDLAEVESALEELIPWAVQPGLDVLASTVLLFVLAPKLALPAMLVFPMALVGPWLIQDRATKASVDRQDHEADVLSALQEGFSGHHVAKAFGLEQRLLEQLELKLQLLRRSCARVTFMGLFGERSSNIGILILELTLLGVGAWRAFEGSLSIGAFASFQVLFGNLAYGLSYVAQYVPSIVSAAGGMARVEEILAEPPAVVDAADALPVPRLAKAITFADVSFRYGDGRTALANVTLTIPAGATVAVVGPTGAGKSTFLSLLLRFHDPTGGRVAFDGHPLTEVTQASVRAQIGVVFQETFLFNTTVREAIRYGQLDASDSEVEEAARAAEVHDAILKLPSGYDTLVGERGARLSGGQRQRIGIARALIRQPSILLLDEPTSALDPATEAALRETLARVSAGRTVIHVTHRLSATTGASRIFVLDHGKLVEEGVHRDLVSTGGTYARLWEKQTSLHEEEDDEDIEWQDEEE